MPPLLQVQEDMLQLCQEASDPRSIDEQPKCPHEADTARITCQGRPAEITSWAECRDHASAEVADCYFTVACKLRVLDLQ